MESSNIEMLCCISQDNKMLKNIIEQQSNEIGKLIREKNEIKEQYEILINYVSENSSNHHTSNIIDTSNII